MSITNIEEFFNSDYFEDREADICLDGLEELNEDSYDFEIPDDFLSYADDYNWDEGPDEY